MKEKSEMKICVSNLNTGKWAWFDLPVTFAEIDRVLQVGGDEFDIIDYEAPIDLSKYSVKDANEIYQKFQELPDYFVADSGELLGDLFTDIFDMLENWKNVEFAEEVSNDAEMGGFLVEEDYIEVPSHLIGYIDEELLGRDFRFEHTLVYAGSGAYWV